jgi:shikimate dehydrogenase
MLDQLEAAETAIRLNGQVEIIPVLGYPVRQVRSPRPLTARMQSLGYNAIQIPLAVEVSTFHAVTSSLQQIENISGFVLTVPHKIAALGLADSLSPRAEAAGSINAMRREADGRWFGENFDGAGFLAGLRAEGHDPRGKAVMIVGLGGAGASLAASLADAGASHLKLFDLDISRAHAVQQRLDRFRPEVTVTLLAEPRSEDVDLAVNATHLGMDEGDALPFDPTLLRAGTVVADAIMNPAETRLLKRAAELGLPIVKGENILFYQLDLLAEFFAKKAP